MDLDLHGGQGPLEDGQGLKNKKVKIRRIKRNMEETTGRRKE